MIEIDVLCCVPGRTEHQIVLNVNGIVFWLQKVLPDQATARAVAEQVRKDISTNVARYPKSAPSETDP